MTQPLLGFLAFAVGIVLIAVAPVVAVWVIMQVLKALRWAIGGAVGVIGGTIKHVLQFGMGVVVDSLQCTGSVLTASIVLPLAIANVVLFRLSAARHYAAALEDELLIALACVYRVAIGHPVRLLGLGALTDGLERRLPELLEEEPTTGEARRGRTGGMFAGVRAGSRAASNGVALRRDERPSFEGYEVTEEMPAGGSGARLFAARPTPARVAQWRKKGIEAPTKVVIKAFDPGYGSTIPQIVRESRSLEAAKRLGLVLDHSLEEDAFHYVMPFVPGNDLDTTTRELHAASSGQGLDAAQLRTVLGYARDLCDHLTRFHEEGLWHKDIKPSNLMVAGRRLQVVDFGLVTPLESALTLTTHGTEYFRDPELVRLALAGRRVKDVDGVKFDLYSAGAVIYSMVENSFPAHGSLSSIAKPAPSALRWIVRRAMADIDKRYASAEELGRDLDVLIAAKDPNSVRPADLPSVNGSTPPPRPAPASGDAAHDEDAELLRFSAFGLTAEVPGLSRAKRSLDEARAAHRARRERARTARENARQEKIDACARARTKRRRRARGFIKAFCVLAVFGGIAGGLLEFARPRHAGAAAALEPGRQAALDGVPTFTTASSAAPIGSVFHSSMMEDLSRLESGARVLLVADPSRPQLSREAERVAARIRELGLAPVGFAGDEDSTVDVANVAILSDAIIALDQRPTGQSVRQCLHDFLLETPEIDAVLHLSTAASGRALRTILETTTNRGRARGEEETQGSSLESALRDRRRRRAEREARAAARGASRAWNAQARQ